MYKWRKKFPKDNTENLETERIAPVNNQAFIFIN